MGIFDRFRRRADPPTVVVPEGHTVVTVSPSPEPCVARLESGVWLADFGYYMAGGPVFGMAERRIREHPRSMMLWVVSPPALQTLLHDPAHVSAWLQRLYAVCSTRGAGVRGDVVVLPPEGRGLASLLWALDIGAHEPAPDGVAFVEVHRPDGITTGMAGPAFPVDDALRGTLRTLYEQMDALRQAPGGDASGQLERLRQQEMEMIVRALGPSRPPLPTPLSDLISRVLEDSSEQAWSAFYRAFMRAPVGVIASQQAAGGATRPGLASAAAPDGRVMVLACADRDAFARNFHDDFNVEILGRELARAVLAMPECEGILVNSAATFNSVTIGRDQIPALLERYAPA